MLMMELRLGLSLNDFDARVRMYCGVGWYDVVRRLDCSIMACFVAYCGALLSRSMSLKRCRELSR